ncbi:hypothetical protein [Brachybacterium kimchii]|uniref:SHOCT domain-containing protein n=1 Tax=Brachybacterium kimchii TaxID=2942909 RepID=A0ABY4N736_9MICO|nr:hypothetical protein [Brachybacterium kimchii]UQN30366.1 hypothetical protein M4486_03205 [Brachybacterium kimchii]
MHTAITTALTSTHTAPLLADGGAGPWGAHPVGPFFLLAPLFWLVVLVVAILLLTRGRRRWSAERREEREQHRVEERARRADEALAPLRRAELTLAERFARGDLEEAEYRQRLEVLRASAALTERS